jgi:hypothetical protein
MIGKMHRAGRHLLVANSPQEGDTVGPIRKNTHDEPP